MTAPAPGDKAAKTRGELLTGPVFPMVVKFGVPTMVSMLTPAIYNLTGAYFVSTLGTTAVAALGIVFSLHMILAAVGIMTGQGCASQTSRLLGAGEYEAAGFIAGTGILLSVLGGVAIGVLGLLFDEPLLRVLGATPTIMPSMPKPSPRMKAGVSARLRMPPASSARMPTTARPSLLSRLLKVKLAHTTGEPMRRTSA